MAVVLATQSRFVSSQNGFAIIEADRKSLTVSLIDGYLKVLHLFTIAAGGDEAGARHRRAHHLETTTCILTPGLDCEGPRPVGRQALTTK